MSKEDYVVVHKKWAEKFLKSKTEPMSQKDAELFMACSMSEDRVDFPPEEVKNTLQYKILSSRVTNLGLSMSPAVLTYLAATQKAIGTLVMYANALRYWQHVHGESVLDMDAFVTIFPWGFLSEKELEKAWYAQKMQGAPNGNMLDLVYGDPYAV